MIDVAARLRERAAVQRRRAAATQTGVWHDECEATAVLLDLLADAWEAMAHERRGASSAACECPCCQVSRRIGEL